MEFRILGPLEVISGDQVLPLGGRKQRALLALLLLHANEVVSRDRLIEALWEDATPETAPAALQNHVAQLRKVLGRDAVVTRSPGYLLQVDPERVDLERFERGLRGATEDRAPEKKAARLRAALALWRGPPLADVASEPFARAEIARLEELRRLAVEEWVEAELQAGRHAELVAELEAFVHEYPLRERPRSQLMLALYRSGRQAEALQVYQDARRTLVNELGIEPGPALKALEKRILAQDAALDARAPAAEGASPGATAITRAPRSILVVAADDARVDVLVGLAEPLARLPQRHEVILARVIPAGEGGVALSEANARLQAQRSALAARHVTARAAAFTSSSLGADVTRLASEQDVDLLLIDASLAEPQLAAVLDGAPCDVAVLPALDRQRFVAGGEVVVPFGGDPNDWAALELGAWMARAVDAPLKLLGTEARRDVGRRDASRLLATASLAVQRVAGIAAEPVLVAPGYTGLVAGARGATLLVLGISSRWRAEGIGSLRRTLPAETETPALIVRRGTRPGGLSPPGTLTNFGWSLAGS